MCDFEEAIAYFNHTTEHTEDSQMQSVHVGRKMANLSVAIPGLSIPVPAEALTRQTTRT